MVVTKNYVSRIPTSIESNSFSLTLCYRFSLFRTILLPVFFTILNNILLNKLNIFNNLDMPAWRNGLARWTSNPKVVGSNPTVGVLRKTKNPTKRVDTKARFLNWLSFRGAIG